MVYGLKLYGAFGSQGCGGSEVEAVLSQVVGGLRAPYSAQRSSRRVWSAIEVALAGG